MTRPKFTIEQFGQVLDASGIDLALIGGQAVALWTEEYKSELDLPERVTSKDIDFWGDRAGLIALAKKLKTQAHFPDRRLMTRLAGLVQIRVGDEVVRVDVLQSVPGITDKNWDRATVFVKTKSGHVRVLDPVALIYSKFHNLKNFDQTERNDLEQLHLCIRFASFFIADALRKSVKLGLAYVNRVLRIACLGDNQTFIKVQRLQLLDAVPIEVIRLLAADDSVEQEDRIRLKNFLDIRWAQLKENGFVS